uniref:hypothetical protein n=1 Tax=Streptomyces tubercidicus TaxID=47759 RepID=UPI0030E4168D|nr:hypothetical protein OG690_37925 [Streptomyces tubercidicus]
MDIGAQLARFEARLSKVERSSRLSSASLDNTALLVRDDAGSLRAVVGQQEDGTSGINVVNGPTPPTPSAPTVEAALAALTVTWDGTFSDAQVAPLDWMRCEVHVGPTAGFTPDQSTLRNTIETAQGGSVTIPLPYTEWYIKLRSRTSSGVAGAETAAVAGTPRQADAADIVAGAITADLIDVDALNGKTINGATFNGGTINGIDINGATVTGGVLQTNTSGSRVVVTPSPPAGMVNRPTMLLYSGVTGELFPAGLNAGPTVGVPAQPTTALGAPIVAQDSSGAYSQAVFSMGSPKAGSFPGRFAVATNAPTATSEIGFAAIDAASGSSTSGTSYMNLYVKDGNTTGKHSSIYTTGDYVTINANGVDHTFTSSGLSVTGSVMAQNTPYLVSKPSNTDRTSTTTRTADPHLTVSLLANATYIVEFHLYVGGSTFALVVTEWLVPSGATGLKGGIGPASSATEGTAGNNNADGVAMRAGSHNFGTTLTYGRRNVNTNLCYAIETGTVTTTSAGTLALAWAQSTSSTTFNRVGLGSWMRVVRIA